jgi:hypothetical protein
MAVSERISSALQDQAVLEVADSVANRTTIGGGGLAIFGGYTLNEWAIIAGIVLGVLGFVTDLYFKHKRYQLLKKQTFGDLDE